MMQADRQGVGGQVREEIHLSIENLAQQGTRILGASQMLAQQRSQAGFGAIGDHFDGIDERSEEHTSELQSQSNLVCRLLLEKKKLHYIRPTITVSLGFLNITIRSGVKLHCTHWNDATLPWFAVPASSSVRLEQTRLCAHGSH